jgi:hypothetical protein
MFQLLVHVTQEHNKQNMVQVAGTCSVYRVLLLHVQVAGACSVYCVLLLHVQVAGTCSV